jgi:hypothetical protein
MIRSSNGRKELHLESIKKAIEEWKEIYVRFVYQKKFLKIEWFTEIVDSKWKNIDALLCDDWFSYRLFDIIESKII